MRPPLIATGVLLASSLLGACALPDAPGSRARATQPDAASPDVAPSDDVVDAPPPPPDVLVDTTPVDVRIDTAPPPPDAPVDVAPPDARPDVAPPDAGTLAQRSCPTPTEPGCGMAAIPGGTFTMGSDVDCARAPGDPTCAYYASPSQPSVTVGAFALDRYEVTVARFRRWVAAGRPTPTSPIMYRGVATSFEGTVNTEGELNCGSYANYPRSDRENHPINCVNWATAQAFCVWDGGRLPTQAEWELAARGAAGRAYPWGDDAIASGGDRACWSGTATRTSTCIVGSFSPRGDTPEAVHDLAGNVWEWVADWSREYLSSPPDSGTDCWVARPIRDPICTNNATGDRVFRGGSWGNGDAADLRGASRGSLAPAYRNLSLGFRCARDTP